MTTKNLYIHIGTHKTGSSALQRSLLCNAEFLRQSNMVFLEYSLFKNAHILRGIDLEDKTALHEEKSNLEKNINMLVEDNVILSCEEYFGNLDKLYSDTCEMALKLFAVTKSYNCKIIVYVRRQDEFIESSYTQYVKQGESYSFEDFLDNFDAKRFDWYGLVGLFAEAFGKENIVIRPYEKQQLVDGDVVKDFYKTIGVNSQVILKEHEFTNPGYSRSGLEIARIYNKIYRTNKEKKTRMRNLLQGSMKKEKYSIFSFFDYQQRENIFANYKKSNMQIATQYLHRPDGVLFYNPVDDYKLKRIRKNRLVFNDVVEAFEALFLLCVKSKMLNVLGKLKSVWKGRMS